MAPMDWCRCRSIGADTQRRFNQAFAIAAISDLTGVPTLTGAPSPSTPPRLGHPAARRTVVGHFASRASAQMACVVVILRTRGSD